MQTERGRKIGHAVAETSKAVGTWRRICETISVDLLDNASSKRALKKTKH